jgi:hypothetical protein
MLWPMGLDLVYFSIMDGEVKNLLIDTAFRRYRLHAGGSVLWMFHAVLGADNFRKCIRYYLERNAKGNVDNETLIDALAMVGFKLSSV